jgi:hypothetical protein
MKKLSRIAKLKRFGEFFGEGAGACTGATAAALSVTGALPVATSRLPVTGRTVSLRTVTLGPVTLGAVSLEAVAARRATPWAAITTVVSPCFTSTRSAFTLGRLRRVRTQEFIFERGSVETADNALHFLRVWRFNKGKSFGLLRLGIPDHFDAIGNQRLGIQPGLYVVRCNPGGQVAEEDGETHSVGKLAKRGSDVAMRGNASVRHLKV